MSTFNAGSIEASLTLNRSSWNRELKNLQAQIKRLEDKRIDIAVGMDADAFHRAAAQVELTSDQIGEMSPEIAVSMDSTQFHRAAAEVENVVDIMDANDIGIKVETSGVPKTMAELAELEAEIVAVDHNNVDVKVNYDRNALEQLVGSPGSGGGGGGGYMGLLHILILAGISLSPVLGVAISVLSAQIVAFTAALVGALGPLALLIGAFVVLTQQYVKAQKGGETLGSGMTMLQHQIGQFSAFITKFAKSKTGQELFRVMALGVKILLDILQLSLPILAKAADYIHGLALNIENFVHSAEFKRWLDFFGGFGVQMLEFFMSIIGNLIRFLMNLFIAMRPFATRMMKGLVDDLQRLAEWSKNLGKNKGFQQWMQTATEYAPLLGDLILDIAKAFMNVGDAIRPFAKPMIEVLDRIAEAIDAIPVPILTQLIAAGAAFYVAWKVVLPLVQGLGTAFELLGGAMAADEVAFGLALGPIILIIAAIAALAAMVYYLWTTNEDFRNSIITAWEDIKGAVMPIINDVVALFKEKWPEIQQTAAEVWASVQDIFVQAAGIIQQVVFFSTQAISFLWRHFGDQFVRILRASMDIVIGVIKGAFQIIDGLFRLINDILHGRWNKLWGDIKQIAHGAWTIILALVRGSFNTLAAMFTIAIRALGMLAGKIWDGIQAAWRAGVSWIKTFTGSWIQWMAGVPARIGHALSGMWDGIVSGFRDAINTVTGWWNSLHFSIPGFDPPGPGPKFPGITIAVPQLPHFAEGAVVSSPGLAIIGDAATPEIVTPEHKMADIVKKFGGVDYHKMASVLAETLAPLMGGGITRDMLEKIIERVGPRINVDASHDDQSARAVAAEIAWELRVLGYGGV